MESRPNRNLSMLLSVVIIVVVAAIGYVAVDTLLSLRRPLQSLPGDVEETLRAVVNPTPTVVADPVTIVLEIRALARLETAAYTVEKVVTAESGEGPLGFLFKDRLLLVAHGQVIAGVDMSKMTEADIIVSGNEVFITLPAAEVFVATLDNEQSYVYDRETGLLGPEIDLETLARQEAEQRILEAALEDGILQKAQDNAEVYVRGLVMALGFEEVTFITATPMPSASP
jgi:hypothetical protein